MTRMSPMMAKAIFLPDGAHAAGSADRDGECRRGADCFQARMPTVFHAATTEAASEPFGPYNFLAASRVA